MAHDLSKPNDEKLADTDGTTAECRGNNELLDRRSYLKMAGITAASTLAPAAAAAQTNDARDEKSRDYQING